MYLSENPHQRAGQGTTSGRTREALKNKLTWFFSLFIFLYVGTEVSIGGWIVVFMTKVRNASTLAGSATATGFWGGMTVGRLVLGFVTSRLGGFRAMLLYLGLAIVIELIFWLVPNMVVTAVTSALLGMILGMVTFLLVLFFSRYNVYVYIPMLILVIRTHLSYGSGAYDYRLATLSPHQRHWICNGRWRLWLSCSAFCRRCHCASKGRQDTAADCSRILCCDADGMAIPAAASTERQGGRF